MDASKIDTKKISSASKIPGLYYFEYTNKDTGMLSHIPPSPPFTTWSGLMHCPLESEHGERLKTKCGGDVYEHQGKAWVKGYWTAPTDWPEMAAGREDPRPFSPKTHSISDFPFMSQNLK
jgi:hypothetical protein